MERFGVGGERSLTSQRNGGGDRVNKPNCFLNRFATKLTALAGCCRQKAFTLSAVEVQVWTMSPDSQENNKIELFPVLCLALQLQDAAAQN